MKLGKNKRYYHLTFTGSLIWGVIIAVVDLFLGMFGLISFSHPSLVDLVVFIVSVLSVFIGPIIYNRQVIKKAYHDDLLDEAITASLEGAKQDAERDKYSHFLREITQAKKLNPLKLEIDGEAFDNLYDEAVATLSITEAPLFAWKNPEYSWFLLTHYTVTLLKRIEQMKCNKGSIQPVKITDRNNKYFNSYMKQGFTFLENVSKNKDFTIDGFVRFYLLTKSEIRENLALCEQLVAGHDLYGVHLFLIDKEKVMEDNKLLEHLNDLKKIGGSSNSILDFMVYRSNRNTFEYKIGEHGLLKSKGIDEKTKKQIQRFVKDLAEKLKNNSDWLIYPSKNEPYDYQIAGISTNNKKSFLNVQ